MFSALEHDTGTGSVISGVCFLQRRSVLGTGGFYQVMCLPPTSVSAENVEQLATILETAAADLRGRVPYMQFLKPN
jgi:hypothetical protein